MFKKIGCLLLLLGCSVTVFSAGQINIASVPYTISTPGSYIVVKDLRALTEQTAINIVTSDVTIDLNGHTLYGPGTTVGVFGFGINSDFGINNVSVFNGTVRDFKYAGIYLLGGNDQVHNIRAYGNGTNGIQVGDSAIVWDCTVTGNSGTGISPLYNSIIRNNTITNNIYGILAGQGGVITGNTINYNSIFGINMSSPGSITNNMVFHNESTGINIQTGGEVIGNSVSLNGGGGIYASGQSLIKDNNVLGNGTSGQDGINAQDYGATIINNRVTSHSGWGIRVASSSQVNGNTVYYNTLGGIYAGSGIVSDNAVTYNGLDGIQVYSGSRVTNNQCDNNGFSSSTGSGIHALAYNNEIENNLVTSNDWGIKADTTGNYIAGNRLRGNGISNITTFSGNSFGDGTTGFFNKQFYSQENRLIQRLNGYNIPVLRESPEAVTREIRW